MLCSARRRAHHSCRSARCTGACRRTHSPATASIGQGVVHVSCDAGHSLTQASFVHEVAYTRTSSGLYVSSYVCRCKKLKRQTHTHTLVILSKTTARVECGVMNATADRTGVVPPGDVVTSRQVRGDAGRERMTLIMLETLNVPPGTWRSRRSARNAGHTRGVQRARLARGDHGRLHRHHGHSGNDVLRTIPIHKGSYLPSFEFDWS